MFLKLEPFDSPAGRMAVVLVMPIAKFVYVAVMPGMATLLIKSEDRSFGNGSRFRKEMALIPSNNFLWRV